jgi:hypothetical protein
MASKKVDSSEVFPWGKTIHHDDGSVSHVWEAQPLIPEGKTGRAHLQELHAMLEKLRGHSVTDKEFASQMGMTEEVYLMIVRGEFLFEDYMTRIEAAYNDPKLWKDPRVQEIQKIIQDRMCTLDQK